MWIDGSTTLKRNETEAIKKKGILNKELLLRWTLINQRQI
jgi:hypothetical protein